MRTTTSGTTAATTPTASRTLSTPSTVSLTSAPSSILWVIIATRILTVSPPIVLKEFVWAFLLVPPAKFRMIPFSMLVNTVLLALLAAITPVWVSVPRFLALMILVILLPTPAFLVTLV